MPLQKRIGAHDLLCRHVDGRALRVAVEVGGVQLEAGDRLEPTETMVDVHAFDKCRHFPLRVRFWRTTASVAVVHRNPLLSVPGVTVLSFLIDILHVAYLGPVQSWEVCVCVVVAH